MSNNLNVRMSNLQAKNAELIFKQSKLSQYPNASFSTSFSANSGSNQNPVTFSRITETYLSSGMQLQSSADIFNFYSKRNTIAANQWEVQAAQAQTDKLKNDIALSAANAYLQILLANEQLQIAGTVAAIAIAIYNYTQAGKGGSYARTQCISGRSTGSNGQRQCY